MNTYSECFNFIWCTLIFSCLFSFFMLTFVDNKNYFTKHKQREFLCHLCLAMNFYRNPNPSLCFYGFVACVVGFKFRSCWQRANLSQMMWRSFRQHFQLVFSFSSNNYVQSHISLECQEFRIHCNFDNFYALVISVGSYW